MKNNLNIKGYFIPLLICILSVFVVAGCSNHSHERRNLDEKSTSALDEEKNSSLKASSITNDSSSILDITLDGVETKGRIGIESPQNDEFLIIKITVQNKQKDNIVTHMNSFKLVDKYGLEYDYSLGGQMAWYREINSILDPIIINLYSEGRQELNLVFDIPLDAEELTLVTTGNLPYIKLPLITE